MPDKLNKDFLPSSRSIAFKKKVWEEVGGYPEWLDTGEDLFFAKTLRKKGYKFKLSKKAIVNWPQRKNIYEAFVQFYNYAKGDGTARYFRIKTPFLYLRYFLGLLIISFGLLQGNYYVIILVFLLLFGYIVWSVNKNYRYVSNKKAIFYLPMIQLISDIAVLLGYSVGFINSFNKTKE